MKPDFEVIRNIVIIGAVILIGIGIITYPEVNEFVTNSEVETSHSAQTNHPMADRIHESTPNNYKKWGISPDLRLR